MSRSPRWPGWSIPVVPLAVLAASLLASVVIALAASAAGADELSPGLVLLLLVADLSLAWLILRAVAARAGFALRPADVGLRLPGARMGLVVLGFGLVVALAAAGLAGLMWGGDLDLAKPPEFDEQAAVGLGPASATTILARGVLAAVMVEIVLRGFLVAALLPRVGRTWAVLAGGLLFVGLVPQELLPAGVAVGIALGVMYAESGSILPGIALAGAFNGSVLGIGFDWSVAECVALAAATGAIAFLLAAAVARSWDRDPRAS